MATKKTPEGGFNILNTPLDFYTTKVYSLYITTKKQANGLVPKFAFSFFYFRPNKF